MPDEDKQVTTTESVAPVAMTLVSSTGTGDGGTKTALIQTPAGQPNILATYITPVAALLSRFVTYFLTNLLGVMTTVSATGMIPFHDFKDLLLKSATISLGGALLSSGKDLLTLFTAISKKFPLLDA